MSEAYLTTKRRRRVRLIYNPLSGAAKNSPEILTDIIRQLQAWKLPPEVYLLGPDSNIPAMVSQTLSHGISMFVVCGGDGTISAVATALSGLPVTLGIIPTGTQNNIALSLQIPTDIPAAISVLRTGQRVKIDLGVVTFQQTQSYFLEVCSIGLTSSIFEAADEIQHGNLGKISDFVSTLITSAPSEFKMLINEKHLLTSTGHVLAVTNMPYTARNFQIGNLKAFQDGHLDVLFLGEISKLKMLGYAINKHTLQELDDPRIQSFIARSISIETDPPMTVMVDGKILGEGPVSLSIKRKALGVMTKCSNGSAI